MRGLAGKNIVVTGAASGIGAAIALRLASEGATVCAADINPDGLSKTRADAAELGRHIVTGTFDLANEQSIVAVVAAFADRPGRIDGLVNVAADLSKQTDDRDREISQLDVGLWEHVLRVNLIGTGIVIRETLPHLAAAGGGSIVNISSSAAWLGGPVRPAYASSKIGLHTLTRHIARTWGQRSIRCNAIAPGMIMSEAAAAIASPQYRDDMLARGCAPRLGRPDDIAAMAGFLVSDEAEWITGQIISVDGGLVFRE